MYQYDKKLYDWIDKMTWQDAEVILPCIMNWIKPTSIIDFGCGEGLWLRVAKQLDENVRILGLDGDYIDRNRLKIPAETFRIVDLSQSFRTEIKFDLAISTEVAEHIDEQYSEVFIDNLTNVSDHILFSAAIPGQGGVNHVNEQWQSYWIEKFEKRGYFVDLSVRNYFWNESRLTEWRRQNILYFSKGKKETIAPFSNCYDIVHPGSLKNINVCLKEIQAQYRYSILNLELCLQLNNAILNIIQDYEKIVIYPYGRNGKLCKEILNAKWRRKEYAIVDNLLYKKDGSILSVKDLKDIRGRFIVIDTCSNPMIHKEVLEELYNYVDVENVYTVFGID